MQKQVAALWTDLVLNDMITCQAKKNNNSSTCFGNLNGGAECLEDIFHSRKKWSSEDSVLVAVTKENEIRFLESKNEKQSSSKSQLVEKSLSRGCFAQYRVSSNLLTSHIAPIRDGTESKSNKRMKCSKL